MIGKLPVFILLLTTACVVTISAQQSSSGSSVSAQSGKIILGAPFSGGYLGIQTREVTKENFSKYGLSEARGAAIEKVAENSPAANAGLQKGDIILKFNGEEVTSVFKLNRLLQETAPDHRAKITILRGGAESELTVTVGRREMPTFENGGSFDAPNFSFPTTPEFPRAPLPPNGRLPIPAPPPSDDDFFIFRGGASRQIGVGVSPLTKQLGDYFGAADGKGVLINNVRENSPAARAGLKAGDVVTEADGKEIKNDADLMRAIIGKKDGETINLTIIRDKNRQTVSVAPEVSKDAPAMRFEQFENFGDGQPMRFQMQTPPAPAAPPAPPIPAKPAVPRVL